MNHVLSAAIGVAGFAATAGAAVGGNIIFGRMVGELNRASGATRFNPASWDPSNTIRVFDAYRDAFPEGRLLTTFWATFTLGVVGLLAFFASLQLLANAGA